MVVKRLKITAPGHLPQAIFADLDTLRAAPQPMIAAGVGDVIAKWTSTADWKLGRLLWGDRYDAAIAGRFLGRCSVWWTRPMRSPSPRKTASAR